MIISIFSDRLLVANSISSNGQLVAKSLAIATDYESLKRCRSLKLLATPLIAIENIGH